MNRPARHTPRPHPPTGTPSLRHPNHINITPHGIQLVGQDEHGHTRHIIYPIPQWLEVMQEIADLNWQPLIHRMRDTRHPRDTQLGQENIG